MDPNGATCAALMSGFEKEGSIYRAMQLIEAMQMSGMNIDANIAASSIRAASIHRQPGLSQQMFAKLLAMGIQPTREMALALLSSAETGSPQFNSLAAYLKSIGADIGSLQVASSQPQGPP